MKKLLLLVMMTLGLSVSTLTVQAAEFSGTVGYSSDYFWRGISQNNGVAVPSLELGVEHEGWYAGAMAIPVDFGTSDSLRYDLYTGYNTSLTDKLSIGGGVMQYRHANGIDKATEYYFGGQYSDMLSVMYYVCLLYTSPSPRD